MKDAVVLNFWIPVIGVVGHIDVAHTVDATPSENLNSPLPEPPVRPLRMKLR